MSAQMQAPDRFQVVMGAAGVRLWTAGNALPEWAKDDVVTEYVRLDVLLSAIAVAREARIQWDEAPEGMKAGKLLIALSGYLPGYRADTDAIHAALAKTQAGE